jgi:hypothetical protein
MGPGNIAWGSKAIDMVAGHHHPLPHILPKPPYTSNNLSAWLFVSSLGTPYTQQEYVRRRRRSNGWDIIPGGATFPMSSCRVLPQSKEAWQPPRNKGSRLRSISPETRRRKKTNHRHNAHRYSVTIARLVMSLLLELGGVLLTELDAR